MSNIIKEKLLEEKQKELETMKALKIMVKIERNKLYIKLIDEEMDSLDSKIFEIENMLRRKGIFKILNLRTNTEELKEEYNRFKKSADYFMEEKQKVRELNNKYTGELENYDSEINKKIRKLVLEYTLADVNNKIKKIHEQIRQIKQIKNTEDLANYYGVTPKDLLIKSNNGKLDVGHKHSMLSAFSIYKKIKLEPNNGYVEFTKGSSDYALVLPLSELEKYELEALSYDYNKSEEIILSRLDKATLLCRESDMEKVLKTSPNASVIGHNDDSLDNILNHFITLDQSIINIFLDEYNAPVKSKI